MIRSSIPYASSSTELCPRAPLFAPGFAGRGDLQLRRRPATRFCRAEKYPYRDAAGNPVREVGETLLAADPVHRTASSFGEERERRKHSATTPCLRRHVSENLSHRWGQLERQSFRLVRRAKRATTRFRIRPFGTRRKRHFRCLSGSLRGLHLWAEHGARGTRPAQGDFSTALHRRPGNANHVTL